MDPGSRSGPVPKRCGTRTLGRTPSVWPWNRCVKSCFIINCQLLTPFTSGPFLQKWAGSTSVPSPMWNADIKYPDMKEMCKIMFYIQLPPSDSIHKWPWLNKRAGSKMVRNRDIGEDTKCLAVKPMCQIMFYNQLPTSDTIHKWSLAQQVGRF